MLSLEAKLKGVLYFFLGFILHFILLFFGLLLLLVNAQLFQLFPPFLVLLVDESAPGSVD